MTASSGAEESDQLREAEAYNYNIYAMVAIPYLCLGGVGFLVWRNLRRKAQADAAFTERLTGERPA